MRALPPQSRDSLNRSQLGRSSNKPILSLPYETRSPVETGRSVEQLSQIINLQKWKILAFMALAMAIAVGIQFVIPKSYEASSLVKVDRHSAMGVVGQEATQVSSVDDMDQTITTLMELAQSDPVLRPVAENYNLLTVEKQLKGLSPQETEKKR